jgi:hypothetical protein
MANVTSDARARQLSGLRRGREWGETQQVDWLIDAARVGMGLVPNKYGVDALRLKWQHETRQVGDCWIWVRNTAPVFWYGYRQHRAGPVAYTLWTGKVPQWRILRRCGVRTCCNPAHLFESHGRRSGKRGAS